MKKYEGTCYIGVVGPEWENGECRDSILDIARRPDDTLPTFIRATKGFEARGLHVRRWLSEPRYDFLLLLDHDMLVPPDALERLRSHGLPLVSGFYLRRRYAPMVPVWHKYSAQWEWPVEPMMRDPEKGKLHKIAASGWGCILVHREVAEKVSALLKGEPLVLEDDMDLWPCDLPKVVAALKGLRELVDTRPGLATLRPALAAHTETLTQEIRLLRGSKEHVGSDIRFGFYAHAAGYVMHGDPDVRCGHMLNYPLSPDDFAGQDAESMKAASKKVRQELQAERRRVQQNFNNLIETLP